MKTRTRIALSATALMASGLLLAGCSLGNGYTRAQAESDLADVTCAIPDHPELTQEMADNYAAVNDKLQASTIDDPPFKKSVADTSAALKDMVGTPITEDWNNNLKLACQISKDVRDHKFDGDVESTTAPEDISNETTDTSTPAPAPTETAPEAPETVAP